MKIYEIVIGNHLDDSNFSKMVMTSAPIETISIDDLLGVGTTDWYHIVSFKVPNLIINPHDSDELKEMNEIKSKYF